MEEDSLLMDGHTIYTIQPLFEEVSNDFTYDLYVKPLAPIREDQECHDGASGTSGQRYLIGPGHGETGDRAGIGISVGTNGVNVYEHTAFCLPALLVYQAAITEWTRITIIIKDKTPHLYINGEYKKTGLRSNKENVYASGFIGGLDSYGYYIGYVKDVKLWEYALSETEVHEGISKRDTGEEQGLFEVLTFEQGKMTAHVHNKEYQYEQRDKRDVGILFVRSGSGVPYTPLEESIIKTLRGIVKEVVVALPHEDLIAKSRTFHPDIALFFSPGINNECVKVRQLQALGIKTALWLTDDPYYMDLTRNNATCFDVVFTQELSCVPIYKSYGCQKVYYLPLGADPDVYKPKDVSAKYESDILFVGCGFSNRLNLFDAIVGYLYKKNTLIIGRHWERLKTYPYFKKMIKNDWISPEETANYYNGAKVVLNIHRMHNDRRINRNNQNVDAISINPRSYEISSCGAFQLTDVRGGLIEHYVPGVDLVTYDSPSDLINKIEHYLQHEEERKSIAWNGLEKTRKEHTFINRVKDMLNKVFL